MNKRERERERERLLKSLSKWTFSRDGKYPIVSLNSFSLERLAALEIAINITNNLIDINNISGDQLEQVDLLTYSFPCQDLSLQGKRAGLHQGKSSSLLWQVKRIMDELQKEDKLPRFLLLENVAALFSEANKEGYQKWLNILTKKYGYTNHAFKLNAKYFDVPQHRERAFVLSILNEDKNNKFNDEVLTSRNTLTTKNIKTYYDKDLDVKENEFKLSGTGKVVNNKPEINSNTGMAISKIEGYTTFASEARALAKKGISPTITATGASSRLKVITEIEGKTTLRLLKSEELWQLMSFSKKDIKNASKYNLIPENYLIKQAGNSIVVKVLEAIFNEIKW